MKIKLHWKLTFIFCSAVLLGLLFGYAFLSSQLKTYLDANLQNNLRKELSLARDVVEQNLMDKRTLEDAQSLALRFSRDLGVRATIINYDGTVIGDSDLNLEQLHNVENHLQRVEVQEALQKGVGVSKRYSYTIRKYLVYVAVPFGQGKSGGFLRFAIPLSDVELWEARSQKIVLFSLALVFVLSVGFTYMISAFVSRPLQDMAGIAQAMAKGDFSRKPSVVPQDEIGDLSRALTNMSEEIRDKIDTITQERVKLDAVLSGMSEGVMAIDEKGAITLMNPAMRKLFLIEVTPEGKKAVELVRNRIVVDILDRLLKDHERIASGEMFFGLSEEKVFMVNGVLLQKNNQTSGAVLVFHDITELRRLEKVRQDFVANVSHELRTPIASIKGYAETLLDGALEDPANRQGFIKTIHENSDRLAHLIDDLLDLSRIESGKMKMTFAPVELKAVVQRSLNILEKQIADKRLAVTIDVPDSFPKVLADEARLSQVLLNLLDNAVKYTPDGGAVRVVAFAKEKFVQVDVADNGLGISDNDLPRIFERFYRVDKARSRELGGTGLGLSIVKHIVQAHNGEVSVRSELGRGSTFSFTIPLA
jgi:two-component system, OmpR family, phosphate regulon sensor histidine kinase PhoR